MSRAVASSLVQEGWPKVEEAPYQRRALRKRTSRTPLGGQKTERLAAALGTVHFDWIAHEIGASSEGDTPIQL